MTLHNLKCPDFRHDGIYTYVDCDHVRIYPSWSTLVWGLKVTFPEKRICLLDKVTKGSCQEKCREGRCPLGYAL